MANELILIIEDNEKNRKLVRDVLEVKGYKISLVFDRSAHVLSATLSIRERGRLAR